MELSPASSYRAARRVGVVGWLACASSYYAFFCYAQAAALVFPSVYFPSGVTEVGLIASLATFGVGYVARPVGSIVIGKWADTHGWVDALFRCLLIMGLITLLIGVLPGYDSWGLLAPTLLVLLRIGQGFVMGGLLSCASVLAVELAERNRRGYRAGLVLQGVQAGQLLAAAVFLPLVAAVSLGSFQDWGWRIPFALGVVPVCVAFFVRYRVQESPAFLTVASRGATSSTPLRLAARENLADLVRVAGMALMNVIPTVATVFGATYGTARSYGVEMSTTNYLWTSVVGNMLAVVLIPVFASLSDRVGRKPVLMSGALVSGALSFAFLSSVGAGNTVASFVLAMLMWGIAYQAFNAVFPAFYAELFPTRLRVTGCAVPTSLGVAVTGFLPSVMTTVAPPGANVPIIVGYIALGCVALAVVAIATVRETSGPSAALAGSGTARHDGIFISYRRSDKPEFTRRLYDFLETHLGAERVFMDIRSIGPGEDFVRAIENRLRQMHGHVRRYRSELDERGR